MFECISGLTILFIYGYILFNTILFVFGCAVSSLLCGLFSSCGKHGYCLVAVRGLLIEEALPVAEHVLLDVGFSSCGSGLSSCSSR